MRVHIPHITRLGLKNLGWFKVEEALELTSGNNLLNNSNPVILGLYAFAVCDEKPLNHLWPWEVKYVVDIGKAGGDGPSIRVDYKAGVNKTPKYISALYDRINAHKTEFTPKTSKKEVNESTQKIRAMLKTSALWVNIIHLETPNIDFTKIHLMPDVTQELFLCEDEAILASKNMWGTAPVGNPGAIAKLKEEKRKIANKNKSYSESHFSQSNLNIFFEKL